MSLVDITGLVNVRKSGFVQARRMINNAEATTSDGNEGLFKWVHSENDFSVFMFCTSFLNRKF